MSDELFSDSDDDIATQLEKCDNTIYLTHFKCVYVDESEKNQYFVCSSVGSGEVRLYKKSAQTLLGLLHQAHPMGKKLLKLMRERKLPDKVYFEKVVDDKTDKKTQTRYQLKLVLNVYMGMVCLYLRSYYYITEEERFQPTKRAVQFAIKDEDYHAFDKFIIEKAAPPSATAAAHDGNDLSDDDAEVNSPACGSSKGNNDSRVNNPAGKQPNKKKKKWIAASTWGGAIAHFN